MALDDNRPFLDRQYVETWLREQEGHMYKYELAYKAGITGSTLSALLSGIRKPRPSTIQLLAEAMGVDPEEILIYPEQVSPKVKHEYERHRAKIRKYWRQKRLNKRLEDKNG